MELKKASDADAFLPWVGILCNKNHSEATFRQQCFCRIKLEPGCLQLRRHYSALVSCGHPLPPNSSGRREDSAAHLMPGVFSCDHHSWGVGCDVAHSGVGKSQMLFALGSRAPRNPNPTQHASSLSSLKVPCGPAHLHRLS